MGPAKKRNRGFALTELIVASSIAVLSLAALVGTSVMSTRITAKVSSGVTTISKASTAYEELCSDIRAASGVLASYPTSGTPAFTSNGTNTLILRQPFTNAGVIDPNKQIVIVYYLAPQSGDRGPNVLKRYRATVNGGVEAAATLEKEVASQISSITFNYSAHETIFASEGYGKYLLRSEAQGDTPFSEERALVDGEDLSANGTATFVAGELRFTTRPTYGKLIDAYYNVDPTTVVGANGLNNAFEVLVAMKASPKWRDGRQVEQTRNLELISRVALRNR